MAKGFFSIGVRISLSLAVRRLAMFIGGCSIYYPVILTLKSALIAIFSAKMTGFASRRAAAQNKKASKAAALLANVTRDPPQTSLQQDSAPA
ncbi:hypothetical protein [uncultured Slackia sp.]|uniref:hypothetical protein n=1 Tax=uncultured Slackia sp. TaxID=665903 RepID=UPI0025E91186|nr:hypothetical protein [uncultured Slackia sp.]